MGHWLEKQWRPSVERSRAFFLVTRLTGYTVETALGLIEKANNSLGERGIFALDLATNRNDSGYKFWNDDLYTANTTLNGTMGYPTYFDESSTFLTNISNVMGYASWGSNDGAWAGNMLPNGGFDAAKSTSSSGAEHWDATLPSLSSGDSFNWSLQSDTTHGGSSALEAAVAAECSAESGDGAPGIFAEFFDNAGVSFNTGSMPSLIDRVPDHTRIETKLDFPSRNSAYPGLDNRFKNDWGARFSGLIDIPEAGNWTFYLTTDDGSELWINEDSLVQNYGSHGMREVSGTTTLDAGSKTSVSNSSRVEALTASPFNGKARIKARLWCPLLRIRLQEAESPLRPVYNTTGRLTIHPDQQQMIPLKERRISRFTT